MARSNLKRKQYSSQSRLGQQGINLIEEIVLAMKSRWVPGGAGEVGIDGYIELFDPTTSEAVGRTLAENSLSIPDSRQQGTESIGPFFNQGTGERIIAGFLP